MAEYGLRRGGHRLGRTTEGAPGRPAERPGDQLLRARTSFLVDEVVPTGVVRDTILASWSRSREWDIQVDNVELQRRLGPRARLPAVPCGHEHPGRHRRRAGHRTRQRHPHRRRGRRAGPAHRRLGPAPGAGPDLAGPRLQLRGEVRRHQRHRHALEGRGPAEVFGHEHYVEPSPPRLLRRAHLAPGHRQADRRHRPDLLASRRRPVHGDRGHRIARQIEGRCSTSPARASSRCCTTTSPRAAAPAAPSSPSARTW